MSYDVWFETRAPGGESVKVYDAGNYTSNVASMWDFACDCAGAPHIRDLDGRRCSEVAEALTRAHTAMILARDVLMLGNPANGWGNIDGATDFLGRIQAACHAYPDAIVRVYR